MAFEKIYEHLMEAAVLTDVHRQELITKRGFSDDTIKAARLGSGGAHLADFDSECRKKVESGEYREQDMVLSGVFIHDGKTARLNPMLLRESHSINNKEISNILIPYLNENDEVYLVRPHKMGLGGVPIEIYQSKNLAPNPAEIILTEGEFKAIAGEQYRFPTIAVPGIQSFSETKFPQLIKLLKSHAVRRVVVMFDNETKDDPNFPERFKKDINKRYDTQFYTYYMASKLEKEGGFDVVIAVLPDGWKENGKIDIDGCAAQMRTQGEMKKIVYDAIPRNEYLRELPSEAKQIVLRKNQQKHHRSRIHKEFNRYIMTKTTAKGSFDIVISNFVMKVIATHDTPEGVKREVEFTNEFGRKSSSFTVPPESMASGDAFRSFALSRGDFIWRGTTDDLLTIWESEFLMMDEGRYIIESDHIGWIEKKKLWLFGNVVIRDDGTEIWPDGNGIFWLEKEGIKPVPLSIASGRHTDMSGLPYLNTGKGIDVNECRDRLSETIGKNEASLLLGWISAVPFMEEVFGNYRSFPFLFVTGRWQSGKSTIAEWAANFFGIEDAGKAISQTTAVAIQRSLAYYSCLPVCLDEYRNTKDVVQKNGFLRNVYNRQSSGKGLRDSDFGLRDAKVRGTLILAGEETPKDGALLSRCIVVFISRANRQKDHFQWFMNNRFKFSNHFYQMLKTREKKVSDFMKALSEWKDYFVAEGINDRTAINYATIVSGYEMVYGGDEKFALWLANETKVIQSEHAEEQAISIFIDDLGVLKTRRIIDDSYWAVSSDKIYLYFHGLHQLWAQEFRKTRGEEAFKEGSIRAYLKEEPGFVGMNVSWRIKGAMKKCVVFDLKTAPYEILNLVDHNQEVFL